MSEGRVVIDLVAPQSPSYRERGIARHGLDFTRAVLDGHADLVAGVLVHPELPPAAGLDDLIATGKVSTVPDWPGEGGVFHVTSAFELEVPARALWPRLASTRRMWLAVTVYDLIPDIFPELYLMDPGLRRRWRACREMVRAADHVFTLSESGAADVVERLGVAESRVTVIGAAHGERFRLPDSRASALAMARAGVSGLGEHFIVYNGAIDPRKNVDRLLDAYAALPGRVRARWQLVLVCRTDALQRNHYELRACELGIEQNLLLPGYVDDDVLVSLYQSADLAVFPSLYEGYGLPVVEAQACGAPAIASDNSSLRELVIPEARFDPLDTAAIASAMERALTDPGLRSRLLDHGGRPRQTWADVADRAAGVYRRLIEQGPPADGTGPDGRMAPGRRGGGRPIRPGWRRRPAVALVSAGSSSGTEFGMWAERLAAALGRHGEVDVYSGDASARPPSLLARLAPWRGGYDAVYVCLADDAQHAEALGLLLAGQRAIVLADDLRMTEVYQRAASRGLVPGGFVASLRQMYPGLASDIAADGSLGADVARRHGILMAREVIAAADRFLLTSSFAAALARVEARPEHRERVGVLPFACPPPVGPEVRAEQPGLVGAIGQVPSAEVGTVVAAFAALSSRRPDALLVVLGTADDHDRQRWTAEVASAGIADRVEVTGPLDDRQRRAWLTRCSVALHLSVTQASRIPSVIGDCLAAGVATVASDIGPLRDLPAGLVKVPIGADDEAVAAAVEGLLDDPQRRGQVGSEGRSFAAAHGIDRVADALIALAGERRPDVERLAASP